MKDGITYEMKKGGSVTIDPKKQTVKEPVKPQKEKKDAN